MIASFLVVSVMVGLPPGLLDAVCYVETGHNPYAIHKHDGNGDSVGICQVKKSTCNQMGVKGDLFDVDVNIECAGKYLKYQLDRYNGDYARAVTAFNRGRSTSHGGTEYLAKVFNYLESHQRIEGGTCDPRASNRKGFSKCFYPR